MDRTTQHAAIRRLRRERFQGGGVRRDVGMGTRTLGNRYLVMLRRAFIARCRKLGQLLMRLFRKVFPSMSTIEAVTEWSETCDWMKAPVRKIIFNPRNNQHALLTCKDAVLLYTHPNQKEPMRLISDRQKHISCGTFQPVRRQSENSLLVVGGAGGMCLWQGTEMRFFDCRAKDFVVEMQWMNRGSQLACALLGQRCIQIWRVSGRGEILRQVETPQHCSYLWMLRHGLDMDLLRNDLTTNAESGEVSLSFLENKLFDKKPLQTGCWTPCGLHFLYVPKGSSKVFAAIPKSWVPNKWLKDELIDLSIVECHGVKRDCGRPVALSIDPYNIYVAFIFERRPFALICLLHTLGRFKVELETLEFIEITPVRHHKEFPTCIVIGIEKVGRRTSRLLVISWSSGYVQQMPLTACTVHEAQQDQYNFRFPNNTVLSVSA